MTSSTLTELFQRDGFVYLPGFLTSDEVATVHTEIDRLRRDVVPTMPPEHAFYEQRDDPATLKQLQALFSYSALFNELLFGSRFERLASELLADEVVGKNMQYFNKPARIGQSTPAHQDGYYFKLEPNEAVTMWLGLEDVDEENGCVRYVRGSHQRGMRPHGRTQTLGFSQGMTDFGTPDDRSNEVYFRTGPGDLLVHHALTIHRADANQSATRSRQALGFIYYAGRAQEQQAGKEAYRQQVNEIIKK